MSTLNCRDRPFNFFRWGWRKKEITFFLPPSNNIFICLGKRWTMDLQLSVHYGKEMFSSPPSPPPQKKEILLLWNYKKNYLLVNLWLFYFYLCLQDDEISTSTFVYLLLTAVISSWHSSHRVQHWPGVDMHCHYPGQHGQFLYMLACWQTSSLAGW